MKMVMGILLTKIVIVKGMKMRMIMMILIVRTRGNHWICQKTALSCIAQR